MDWSLLKQSASLAAQRCARRVSRAWADALNYAGLPGYAQLPRHTRAWLNIRALGAFIASPECLRLGAYFLIWQLAAYTLVWHFDLRTAAAVLPQLLACVWVWPWLADARRRHIDRLLGGRWPQ
jgi:hypothetical protein